MLARRLMPSKQTEDPSVVEAKTKLKAAQTLDNYEANLQMVRSLSNIYHFDFYSFWQPSLAFGGKPIVPYEAELIHIDENSPYGGALKPMRIAYREADRRAPDGKFIFLGDVFDTEQEPLYLDEWHLGPKGNELIAKAIAKRLPANLSAAPQTH